MSAQDDETLVRRLFEQVWNQHNAEAAKEIVADHYTSIENQAFDSTPGPTIVAAEVELYDSLYGDLRFHIDRMFTGGDTIVTIWKATGISKQVFFTNRKGETVPKSLEAEGVSLSQVTDNRITAHRFLWPRNPLFPP
jgi:hypothetical protein